MKHLLLIVLIITLLMGIGICLRDKVIVVQLVIPEELLPYYQWLISFPGMIYPSEPPAPDQIPSYNTGNA